MQALFLFLLFVGGLWLYHIYLAFTNQTTYESSFRDRVPYLKDLPEHVWPFSRGVKENLRQFCWPPHNMVYTIKPGR
jgi:palmitoyltransferase